MCSPSDATSPSLSRRESFHERHAAALVSTRALGAGATGQLQPSEYGQLQNVARLTRSTARSSRWPDAWSRWMTRSRSRPTLSSTLTAARSSLCSDRAEPAPIGFDGITPLSTGGTIYPGLIELHNHLSYNVLPLWSPVPKLFQHRGQWPDHPDYRKLISGPMTVVGQYRDTQGNAALLAPLVRYVECKCLLGGVTTSQGVMLNSNAGVQRFYRGIVRNVEQTDDTDLAEAQGRIADVDAKDARSFLARLNKEDSCFLLHLSEGVTAPAQTDSVARRHFLALQVAPDTMGDQ